ncbi:glutamate ABC transporter substrate-binding protein [Phytohabitans rumicis]|uniref:ABC transporter substrate-binding protein n=1 Tax=Phytohabitans rumicis TaxID=1076125 RepID=A0A6V8LJ70_9ACTN|nr:glutamate ABC transporter substrate-binding protein [Phytohabitans rumicis]GFJ94971.1 ABC transporter substrate-binding protein [Phytohabitans rumicis]
MVDARLRGLLLAAVLVVAGCGQGATPSAGRGVDPIAAPQPLGVRDPAPQASAAASGPAADACDRRASLRPGGSLPAPRRMPSGSTMEGIFRGGRLIVGIDQDAYLFSYRDQDGRLVGFEIDIARRIAAAIFGDPDAVQFRAISTAERVPVLERGDVHMVIRTMTMTCERWQQVAFSTEYLSSGQRLLVRAGSGINGLADLGGRKICATNGSSSIPNIQRAASRPIAVATDLLVDCLVLLQQGQVDAISSIDTLLATLAAQDPNTTIVGDRITDDPAGIAMPRDDADLVRFVNAVLDEMRADGSWRTSYRRWFGGVGPVPQPPAARYRD